ncbi:MAG: hypothetical protein H6977_20665 [Gammaproteobacteria bacterium]|nr:hypothetical protein [Gammaproteobacteria bacterium]
MITESTRRIATFFFAGVLASALCAGCERQAGPAEQAGKQIDEATSRIGDKVEQIGDDMQDAAQGAK